MDRTSFTNVPQSKLTTKAPRCNEMFLRLAPQKEEEEEEEEEKEEEKEEEMVLALHLF